MIAHYLGEIWTRVAWSTMVKPWLTMINHGGLTMVSIVSMVDHGQPCLGKVVHGQTWSFSNLTMVDHGHYKLSMSDYGQPWSNVKVKILIMVTTSYPCLTMVNHGQMLKWKFWPWLTMVGLHWSVFDHGQAISNCDIAWPWSNMVDPLEQQTNKQTTQQTNKQTNKNKNWPY